MNARYSYDKFTECPVCELNFKKKYHNQRYCSLNCYSKINPVNQAKVIKMPNLDDSRLAEFLGIMAGDGCFGPHYISISLNAKQDGSYAFFVRNLCEELFGGSNPTVNFQKRDNVHRVQLSSVEVVKFLKKIWPLRHVIPDIIIKNNTLKIHFVRGLIDTEGSIGFKIFHGKYGQYIYKQLTFTNFNHAYIKFVYEILKNLKFRITKPARNIYISNKEDIERYFKIIGSHNPKLHKKQNVENFEDYLDYRREQFNISILFDNFRKYGGVAEWLQCTGLENRSPV